MNPLLDQDENIPKQRRCFRSSLPWHQGSSIHRWHGESACSTHQEEGSGAWMGWDGSS